MPPALRRAKDQLAIIVQMFAEIDAVLAFLGAGSSAARFDKYEALGSPRRWNAFAHKFVIPVSANGNDTFFGAPSLQQNAPELRLQFEACKIQR
jgi:hypothetical protein